MKVCRKRVTQSGPQEKWRKTVKERIKLIVKENPFKTIFVTILICVLAAGALGWYGRGPTWTPLPVAEGLAPAPSVSTIVKKAGLAPSATVGANCGQKDCVIVPFQHYTSKGEYGVGNFKDCVSVPNQGDAKVVRCKDENGWFARFAHDLQGRLRDVKHES